MTSLAALLAIIDRTGGYTTPEQQQAIAEARLELAQEALACPQPPRSCSGCLEPAVEGLSRCERCGPPP